MSAVTREFTYLLVKSGSIVLKAESDMRGYTPGQVIKLAVNIHNQSGKTTSMVVASLMQVTFNLPLAYLPMANVHDPGLCTINNVAHTLCIYICWM